MAAQSIATTVLAQNYAGDVIRQVNRKVGLLRVIPVMIDEGKNVAWAAETDGATAVPMAEGGGGSSPTSDAQEPAVLNWAYYEQITEITGPAQAAASTSRTPEGNLNQKGRQIANSLAALVAKINAHCFNGDGSASPKEVTGLNAAIGDDSNTYASIVRGSTPLWKPYLVNPGAATTLSIAQIREDLKEIYVKSGEYPDIAVCHPSVFNEVANLFESQRQLPPSITTVSTARGDITLGGGGGLNIDGTIFIKDKDATLESGNGSGRIYYLNTNYVSLQVLPQPEFRTALPGALEEGPEVSLRANDGFGAVPLLAVVKKLAETGDALRYMSKTYCELRVKKPNACGVRRFVKLNAA